MIEEDCADVMDYPVLCARCGEEGTAFTFVMEEGDEWECVPCNKRCNEQERQCI